MNMIIGVDENTPFADMLASFYFYEPLFLRSRPKNGTIFLSLALAPRETIHFGATFRSPADVAFSRLLLIIDSVHSSKTKANEDISTSTRRAFSSPRL